MERDRQLRAPEFNCEERRTTAGTDAFLDELSTLLAQAHEVGVERLIIMVETDRGTQQVLRSIRVVGNLLILSGDVDRIPTRP